ncbi:methionine biosynthesis protein MetW [Alcanivorax sp. JB21]|uniref:methionine biosynthesis protein MetW n=1 Tax=Alcanivorax limicola TaxID=2874102 RepID=UPI001CBCD934|nr:methionine biosynthesis protein MetW [Alcanivorax limicola]MBZ2188800.1 methionine biosynthesis protein MetW [Alcanivorax limicola]
MRTDLSLIREWIPQGARVLDLGCGEGQLLQNLRDTRNVQGYGLEIDQDNIAGCIRRGVNVIEQDIDEGLGNIADKRFDYVLMTQALQAVQRPDLVLAEMLRVGREAIVTFPNFGHWRVRGYLFFKGRMPVSRRLPYQWYDTPNIHLCTVNDFDAHCRQRGYRILDRLVLNNDHASGIGTRLWPNVFGEIAIYRVAC